MKKTLINIFSNTAARFIPMFAAFFLIPFILKHVGKEVFGAWVIIGSFIGISIVFNLGFGFTLEKEIAKYKTKNFPQAVNNFLFSTKYIQIFLSIIIIVIAYAFVITIATFTKMSESLKDCVYQLRYLIVLGAFLKYWISNFESIVRGLERHYILLFRNFLYVILYVIFLIIILPKHPDLYGLLISDIITTVFLLSFYIYYLLSTLKVNFRLLQPIKIQKSILIYSLNAFILQLCAVILFTSGKLLLGVMVSVAGVAYYAIGAKIFDIIRNIFDQISRVFLPKAASLYEKKKKALIATLIQDGTLHLLALWGAICIPLLIVLRDFIILWIGKDFLKSLPIAYVLIISTGFIALSRMSLNVFMGIGLLKRYSQIRIIATVVFIILTIMLIQSFAVLGLALSMLIYSICSEIIIIIYTFRKFNLDLRSFAVRWFKLIFLQFTIAMPAIIFLTTRLQVSYLTIGATFLLYNFLYWIGYYIFILSDSEKKWVSKGVKAIFSVNKLKVRKSNFPV